MNYFMTLLTDSGFDASYSEEESSSSSSEEEEDQDEEEVRARLCDSPVKKGKQIHKPVGKCFVESFPV